MRQLPSDASPGGYEKLREQLLDRQQGTAKREVVETSVVKAVTNATTCSHRPTPVLSLKS
jgi:hypothetical protein